MVSSLGLVISFFFPSFLSLIYNDIFGIKLRYTIKWGFPGSSDGKESACKRDTWVQSLGWEDPLGEGMATHSSSLAWRIPMGRGILLNSIEEQDVKDLKRFSGSSITLCP